METTSNDDLLRQILGDMTVAERPSSAENTRQPAITSSSSLTKVPSASAALDSMMGAQASSHEEVMPQNSWTPPKSYVKFTKDSYPAFEDASPLTSEPPAPVAAPLQKNNARVSPLKSQSQPKPPEATALNGVDFSTRKVIDAVKSMGFREDDIMRALNNGTRRNAQAIVDHLLVVDQIRSKLANTPDIEIVDAVALKCERNVEQVRAFISSISIIVLFFD